jgi:hypothetical protein
MGRRARLAERIGLGLAAVVAVGGCGRSAIEGTIGGAGRAPLVGGAPGTGAAGSGAGAGGTLGAGGAAETTGAGGAAGNPGAGGIPGACGAAGIPGTGGIPGACGAAGIPGAAGATGAGGASGGDVGERTLVALIALSASTNSAAANVYVYSNASAERMVARGGTPKSYVAGAPEVVAFLTDLQRAGPIAAIRTGACPKPISFATTMTLIVGAVTTGDLECPVSPTTAQSALIHDCAVLTGLLPQ